MAKWVCVGAHAPTHTHFAQIPHTALNRYNNLTDNQMAAIIPARRADRLDIIQTLAYE
jgi:ABC-type lipoprotein release transport system permease subunit